MADNAAYPLGIALDDDQRDAGAKIARKRRLNVVTDIRNAVGAALGRQTQKVVTGLEAGQRRVEVAAIQPRFGPGQHPTVKGARENRTKRALHGYRDVPGTAPGETARLRQRTVAEFLGYPLHPRRFRDFQVAVERL